MSTPSYDYDGTVASIASHRREARTPPATASVAAPDTASPGSAKLEHLQRSVELFSDLSARCPMTPLLWMQYADDAGDVVRGLLLAGEGDGGSGDEKEAEGQAAETRLNILELGISEFPGCALLRLRHLEALVGCSTNSSGDADADAIGAAFDDALSAVGRGSHRNEDGVVAAIYRLQVGRLLDELGAASSSESPAADGSATAAIAEAIDAAYVGRARTPMKDENDSLADEIRRARERTPAVLSTSEKMAEVEDGRRYASRTFDSFANLEDEVDVAMAEEGLSRPPPPGGIGGDGGDGPTTAAAVVDWDGLLNGPEALGGRSTHLMGLGGPRTAAAFAKYAGALSNRARRAGGGKRKRGRDGSDEEDGGEGKDDLETEWELFTALATSVYERGVSECPTVESLWVSYVRHLLRLVAVEEDENSAEKNEGKNNDGAPGGLARLSSRLSFLKSVCARSVRNCPYSVTLTGLRMRSLAAAAEVGSDVFDPDRVMEVATEATAGGFLPTPEAQLEVHIMALRTVRRRILSLACAASPEEGQGTPAVDYHGSETMEKKKKKKRKQGGEDAGAVVEVVEYNDLDADSEQEVQDLIDDSREMYDAADSLLRKDHPSWTEGRAALWSNRARAEASLHSPLLRSLGEEQGGNNGARASDEAVRCFEKSVRLHQPPHPDLWMTYIHYVQSRSRHLDGNSDPPGATAAKFRKVRGLFHRAMASVKKQKANEVENASHTVSSSRDYGTALYNLCHEYLEFERMFGSDESYGHASKAVKGKLCRGESANASLQQVQDKMKEDVMEVGKLDGMGDVNKPLTSSEGKRKLEDETVAANGDVMAPAQKRLKVATEEAQPAVAQYPEQHGDQTEKKTNLKVIKHHPEHKLRINNLDYPAHPFTVRVSNLSSDTEDMDLVDTFRPKCGAIVQARILREKHQHPRNGKAKSKGSGLIQFEERESVEKALELDGVLGLHDKLVKVERSHIPAVGVVLPGMHRVKPKGEGRSTKRNQKRKGAGPSDINSVGKEKPGGGKRDDLSSDAKAKSPKARQTSVLSFRPRGLHGQKHHKVKIDLGGKNEEKDT